MEILVEKDGEQGISNYSALIAAVNEQLSTYRGLVVLEDNIPAAKGTVAELRKMAKAASDYRISIKKKHDEKIAQTISQLKEITDLYTKAADEIDSQVKGYETAAQEMKRKEIEAFFKETFGKLTSYVSIQTVWNPRWLNKTYDIETVKAEITDAANRATAGTRAIMQMNSPNEAALMRLFFDTLDLSRVMEEKERLDEQYAQLQKEKERLAAAESPMPQIATQLHQETIFDVQSTTAAQNTENASQGNTAQYTICFKVCGTREQIIALREFLMDTGIKYQKIQEEKA